MDVKLFIGGFPLEMDEMALAQLIGQNGRIKTLKIIKDKKTRICKDYVFVEISSEQNATAVVAALDGIPIGSRKLSVKIVETPIVQIPVIRYEKVVRHGEDLKKKRPRRNI